MKNMDRSGRIRAINARTRFFPAWWTFIGATGERQVRYRVNVADEAELALAKQVKPDIVDAEFVMAGKPKLRA